MRRGAVFRLDMTEDGALEVAYRSRGTPRVAGRLLRRVRDFATVCGQILLMRASRILH